MKPADLHARISFLVDELAHETDAVRASVMFQSYLDRMARFHQYSWNNQMLVYLM